MFEKRIGWTTAPKDYDYGCSKELAVVEVDLDGNGRIKTYRQIEIEDIPARVEYQISRYFSGLHGFMQEDPRQLAEEWAAMRAKIALENKVFREATQRNSIVELESLLGIGERHESGVVFEGLNASCIRTNLKSLKLRERLNKEEAEFLARTAAANLGPQVIVFQTPGKQAVPNELLHPVTTFVEPDRSSPEALEQHYQELKSDESDWFGGKKVRPLFMRLVKMPVDVEWSDHGDYLLVNFDGKSIRLDEWYDLLDSGALLPYQGEALPEAVLAQMDLALQGKSRNKTGLDWLDCGRVTVKGEVYWCNIRDIRCPWSSHDKWGFWSVEGNSLTKVRTGSKLHKEILEAISLVPSCVESIGHVLLGDRRPLNTGYRLNAWDWPIDRINHVIKWYGEVIP
jgi:hypothetical protein